MAYAPALSIGSPLAMYSRMSASLRAEKWTAVVSERTSTKLVPIKQTPVIT